MSFFFDLPAAVRRAVVGCLLACLFVGARAADDFLPPEQAFRVSARAADARTVEVTFAIADGYYLYRDQFKVAADEPGVTLGAPQLPPGKVKFDDTFQKQVETYRGTVVMTLPVQAAPAAFVLRITSQGCADKGLCYPPMQTPATVRLAGFGGSGEVAVQAKAGVDAKADAGVEAAALSTPAPATAAVPSAGGDANESGVEAALRGGRLWVIVGVFFVAGLLLSFTPCVLPMLPILSSIIVGQQAGKPSRSRGLLLAGLYALGMALVYTALGVAAGLAGEGLAATLQKPAVLIAFALVLTALALSMFGAYELQLPAAVRDRLAQSSGRLQGGQVAGVFVMGGLSALIVSPCVAAPLAGALLYISQTRDVALGGAALFSLAAGMSVPLLLLGASAGALLPKAGSWMDAVKRFFGVLLLGVAWWIVAPVLPAAAVVAGWGVLLIATASLLGVFDRSRDGAGLALGRAAGFALVVAGATQIVGAAAGAQDPLQPLEPFVARVDDAAVTARASTAPTAPNGAGPAAAAAPARAATPVRFQRVASIDELDAALRTAGRPVMLDFYADWCVSCKEMERFTFNQPEVRSRLDKVLLLQADVTRNNDADRALLKRFKLFGPPGIVFFDATGKELDAVRVIGFQNPERFGRSLQAAGL